MRHEFTSVERHGAITIVTINRPQVLNALHSPAHFELDQVFNEFAADETQSVAIITGAGERAFCAGNDLKCLASGGDQTHPDSGFGGITSRFGLLKPVIAAVNGVAMGGGFEIALACDIILASDDSVFALPEPRVGRAALAGGLHRLPRQIGLKNAMGMILTGRHVTAAEGASLGFVNSVVPKSGLKRAALDWASQMLECSQLALRAAKQAALDGLNEPSLQAALEHQRSYPAVQTLAISEDRREGPIAFAEKRRPRWSNRVQ